MPERNTFTMPTGEMRAVLFDMDGTLMDSERLWDIGLRELCARHGFTLEPALRAHLVGMDQTESMLVLHDALGLPREGVPEATRWLLARMRQLFREGVVWRPGARQLLKTVRADGFGAALVTATGRELVNVIIDTIGADNFDVTVCGDEVTRNKPYPQPYAAAVHALGLSPRDCLAIEDSPTGVASAHAAGVPVLAVPSEAEIEPRTGVLLRESLTGVDSAVLRATHAGLTAEMV